MFRWVRLGYMGGWGRAPAARQARGPSAVASQDRGPSARGHHKQYRNNAVSVNLS
jgi:hypothetical protein